MEAPAQTEEIRLREEHVDRALEAAHARDITPTVEGDDMDAADMEMENGRTIPKKRRPKKVQENIFASFGKEQDSNAVQEIQVGNVIIHRFNFKRFWQNDRDLNRFRETLGDRTRFGHLLFDTRMRNNPDLLADVAELSQKHNAFRRSQSSKASRSSPPDEKPAGKPIPAQLRDLQQLIRPPEAKPKKKAMPKGLDLGFGFGTAKKEVEPVEEESPPELGASLTLAPHEELAIYGFLEFVVWNFNTLEDCYSRLDMNGNGKMSFSEFSSCLRNLGYKQDVRLVWQKICPKNVGHVSLQDFLDLKPHMLEGMVQNKIRPRAEPQSYSYRPQATSSAGTPVGEGGGAADGAHLASTLRKRTAPAARPSTSSPPPASLEMPQVFPLLLFRNADQYHCGETVFIKGPVRTLPELLQRCGEQLRPWILPVTSLLRVPDMKPVRSLEDLEPSNAYVLKGMESVDPPVSAFRAGKAERGTLRALSDVKAACQAECLEVHHTAQTPLRSLSCTHLSGTGFDMTKASWTSSVSMDRHGSPPWSSTGALLQGPPRAGSKWQPGNHLAACLSHGGHGQLPAHHRYETWPLVRLSTSDRGFSRSGSASAASQSATATRNVSAGSRRSDMNRTM
eukprot:TRINITY_DN14378_c0_g2_i1.p1 TRINITY_DN14378_c0_g2~~TRINITY_DN14378_c0_g2_i1.p1  ORF type:complete len:621 (+),score=147.06 TRINITY_DN14378_c0_g2_i1:182-2044(+)